MIKKLNSPHPKQLPVAMGTCKYCKKKGFWKKLSHTTEQKQKQKNLSIPDQSGSSEEEIRIQYSVLLLNTQDEL